METSQTRHLELAAPAKINLWLRVVRKRPDGYHQLETWMQKLDFGDTVTLRPTGDGSIRLDCSDGSLPQGPDNLAWKAAALYFSRSARGKGCGVAIHIDKRIPVAAGLGGGSSDAGAVLRGLNRLFGDEFAAERLSRMALQLGADVPFFAAPHDAVIAGGVGEEMLALPSLAGYGILLVNPGFSVSTRWVFENLALTTAVKESKLASFRKDAFAVLARRELVNDLESVTLARYPELSAIKTDLMDAGAETSLMSGSGPTVFGLFPDASTDATALQAIAAAMRRKYGDAVYVTRAKVGASPSG